MYDQCHIFLSIQIYKKIITNFMLWSLVFYQKKTPISRLVFVVSVFLCPFDEGEIT